MITTSSHTYYLGELFHPGDDQLGGLITRWFEYVTPDTDGKLEAALADRLALRFAWRNRTGARRWLPSRLVVLRHTRRWFGWPRPLMKDPIAVFSAAWLAETFQMDVLCLVRHPAAFVASLKVANWHFDFQNLSTQPRLMADWLEPYASRITHPPDNLVEGGALLWLCIAHFLTRQQALHPEWQWWRLEDIAENPLRAFAQIFASLRLPYTRRIQRDVKSYSDRTNPATGGLHEIRRDSHAAQSQWRRILSPAEVDRIRAIVEPVSQLYYSDAEWVVGKPET